MQTARSNPLRVYFTHKKWKDVVVSSAMFLTKIGEISVLNSESGNKQSGRTDTRLVNRVLASRNRGKYVEVGPTQHFRLESFQK